MAQVPPELGTQANPVDVEMSDQNDGMVDNQVFEDMLNDPIWAYFDFTNPTFETPNSPSPELPDQPRGPNVTVNAPNPPAYDYHQASLGQSPAESPRVAVNPFPGSNSTEACLNKALELFPDISHKYVEELCDSHHATELHFHGDFSYVESVIEDILGDPSYPKEKKLKRKRAGEGPDKDWEKDDLKTQDPLYIAGA